jgi:hypothetical protein
VYVNNKLWSVEGDKETHGNGDLVSVYGSTIRIENKLIIVAPGDQSVPDNLGHSAAFPWPEVASTDTFAYE